LPEATGSVIAVLTSLASGLAAAHFLLPPQFSFYIADSRHVAELGFTLLLAVTASKVVPALAHETQHKEVRSRPNEVIE
jgi:K+-sensing histidine kinase KdpD